MLDTRCDVPKGWEARFNKYGVPTHIRGGIYRYIEHRILPGDFLQAVIQNNLRESFARADEDNILKMFNIVMFFYNEAPAGCWGSKEIMKSWVEKREAST